MFYSESAQLVSYTLDSLDFDIVYLWSEKPSKLG